MSKEKLTGEASPEQIELWKKKHRDIFRLVVDGHVGYFKKPDRKTLSYATVAGAKDPIKFNEVLMNNCWVGGSEEIKTDDSLFFSASGKLAELIEIKEAELVKL
ncbi:MAG: hypothetical protein ACNA7V_06705 [Bacteroidales bacterium]